ncbi:hypothetical protein [Sulfurovum sp. AR]|uniref:hypothetical protein n=1 Tax=Sulfurovum sp. AR TaxID=1165841 RepID=UPI00025C4807|nr:hypothetical protein [Sulfurovum sp. AR]EIF51643.1 hypothetical protein SULAR_02228 [Sulfurovum sp. AR]
MIEIIITTIILIGLIYIGARVMYYLVKWRERIRLAHLRSESEDTSFIEEYDKLEDEIKNMPLFDNRLFVYYLILAVPIVLILTLIK